MGSEMCIRDSYCSDDNIRKDFEEALKSRFDLTLLGKAKWYLGMQITQHVTHITLDQSQYAKNVAMRLEKAFKNVIKMRDSPLPMNFVPTNKDCPQDATQNKTRHMLSSKQIGKI